MFTKLKGKHTCECSKLENLGWEFQKIIWMFEKLMILKIPIKLEIYITSLGHNISLKISLQFFCSYNGRHDSSCKKNLAEIYGSSLARNDFLLVS